MLPQAQQTYPPTTIPFPPCLSTRLADLLTNEEIAQAHEGYIVLGIVGTYSEFVRTHLQGCLVGISVLLFLFLKSNFHLVYSFSYFYLVTIFTFWISRLHLPKGRKREMKRNRFPLLTMLAAHLVPSWKPIPIFLAWQYDVMNLDGTYSSMLLDRLEHTPNVPWLDLVCSCIFISLSLFLLGLLNGLADLCFRLMLILSRKACE